MIVQQHMFGSLPVVEAKLFQGAESHVRGFANYPDVDGKACATPLIIASGICTDLAHARQYAEMILHVCELVDAQAKGGENDERLRVSALESRGSHSR